MTPFAATNGTRFFGGFQDYNQNGIPRIITARLAPTVSAGHGQAEDVLRHLSAGVARPIRSASGTSNNNTTVESFIRDRNGVPILQHAKRPHRDRAFRGDAGRRQSRAGAASTHLMQAFSLKSETGGEFDFDFSGTSYNFLRDFSQNATSYGPASER